MWVLVIILLNILPGIDKTTVLEVYPTEDECWHVQEIVYREMAKAYPGEQDFTITCQYVPQEMYK